MEGRNGRDTAVVIKMHVDRFSITIAPKCRYAVFAVRFLEDCVLDFAVLAPNDDNDEIVNMATGSSSGSSRTGLDRGGDASDIDDDTAHDGSTRSLLGLNRRV